MEQVIDCADYIVFELSPIVGDDDFWCSEVEHHVIDICFCNQVCCFVFQCCCREVASERVDHDAQVVFLAVCFWQVGDEVDVDLLHRSGRYGVASERPCCGCTCCGLSSGAEGAVVDVFFDVSVHACPIVLSLNAGPGAQVAWVPIAIVEESQAHALE